MTFRLYPEEQHFWSFNDYGHVLKITRELSARRVLEFGPGSSTLALIEGGAELIDTCEDLPEWADVWDERLVKRFPGLVRQHRYRQPGFPAVSTGYDLALIDGPFGTPQRPRAIEFCMPRARWVLAPTENSRDLRASIEALASAAGRRCDWTATGPLSGGFALIHPAPHPC